jgi:hypothetical protein
MVSIHLINFKHTVLFMDLDYGLMYYECLTIRWFSMYVGDINICLIYWLMLYLSNVLTVFGVLYGWYSTSSGVWDQGWIYEMWTETDTNMRWSDHIYVTKLKEIMQGDATTIMQPLHIPIQACIQHYKHKNIMLFWPCIIV